MKENEFEYFWDNSIEFVNNMSLPILLAKFSFVFLFLSMLFYWFQATFNYNKNTFVGKIPSFTMLLANCTLALMLSIRWVESGHFPLSNLYESLLFLSWSLTSIHFILERAFGNSSELLQGPTFIHFSGLQSNRRYFQAASQHSLAKHIPQRGNEGAALLKKEATPMSTASTLKGHKNSWVISGAEKVPPQKEEVISTNVGTLNSFQIKGLPSNFLLPSSPNGVQPPVLQSMYPEGVRKVAPVQGQAKRTGVARYMHPKLVQIITPLGSWAGKAETEDRNPSLTLGAITSPLALFTNAFATFSLPQSMQKVTVLVPALQSNWLIMHVSVMMVSYAALLSGSLLAIAFLVVKSINEPSSLGYLFEVRDGAKLINKQDTLNLEQTLDNLSYRSIGLGFALLTIGIFSGAVWANEAWGSYWNWDPKETWAFITWLVFALYLHTRLSKGWVGKESALVATFGFLVIWFCYLGVNLFGKGLHSYGWFPTV